MSHDPSKCNCSQCEQIEYIFIENVEIGRYCNIDRKFIEFWGKDECPKKSNK